MRKVLFWVLVAVVVILCWSSLSKAASPGEAQQVPQQITEEAKFEGRRIGGKIEGPRGGYIEGGIGGRIGRGDEGLKPIDPPKFDIPTPGQVILSGTVRVVLWLVGTAFTLLLWAIVLYLIYKLVRRGKGEETRLSDTIVKLRARRTALKARLKARVAEIEKHETNEAATAPPATTG